MTVQGKELEMITKPYGNIIEENVVLMDIPLAGRQKVGKAFAISMAPFELPGLFVFDLATSVPFSMLDFQAPDLNWSVFWWQIMTETNGAKISSRLIEYPWGFDGITLEKCLEEAYTGNRKEAMRRANRLLKSANSDRQTGFTVAIRAYLALGEIEKARAAIHTYAEKAFGWPVYTPTDLLCMIPVFGLLPAIGADEAWAFARDATSFSLLVRLMLDSGYSGLLDDEVTASLHSINGSFPWQKGIDLVTVDMVTANNEEKYEKTLEIAAARLAKVENRYIKNKKKDAHDFNKIYLGAALPAALLPTPLYFYMGYNYCYKYPFDHFVQPDKYTLAMGYLEQIRALCALGRISETKTILAKLDEVTRDRDWARWIYKDGAFLSALHSGDFNRAAKIDRELIKYSLEKAQFNRLLSYGKRRGLAFEDAGRPDFALKSYLGVLDAFDSLYKIAGEDSALSENFNKQNLPFYHRVIDLMVRLNKSPEEVLMITERTKSRMLSQVLLARAGEASGIIHEHREEYRKLLAKHRAQKMQAAALTSPEKRERAKKSVEHIQAKMRRIQKLSGEKGGARTGVLAEMRKEDLISAVGTADSALVYWIGDSYSLGFWIDSSEGKAKVRMWKMPGQSYFQKLVGDYRKLLKNPETEPLNSQAGQELAKLLIPDINVKGRVLVVPDKELYLLPFEALPLKGRYMVSATNVSYMPSLSVALALKTQKRSQAPQTLLALADPAFPAEGKSKKRGIVQAFERSGISLVSLPGTRREVKAIKRVFPDATLLTDVNATESNFRTTKPAEYRYIHFATHGLLGDEITGLGEPSLALAEPKRGWSKREDGFLSASEIVNLELSADLVCLSACNTAAGKLSSGDGVSSLATAFLNAGAKGVVVSTWSVADVATAELMADFYHNLSKGDITSQALRKAKLTLMGNQRTPTVTQRGVGGTRMVGTSGYVHPFYWSPFIHIGSHSD